MSKKESKRVSCVVVEVVVVSLIVHTRAGVEDGDGGVHRRLVAVLFQPCPGHLHLLLPLLHVLKLELGSGSEDVEDDDDDDECSEDPDSDPCCACPVPAFD
ncbi:unnamed protein product [Ilex paraguariensis]|uniref:Secreted protein n=1 Tax=Ilex paraguariensis TaxID=185542 RepID=A0ABC8S7C2_9AQUA